MRPGTKPRPLMDRLVEKIAVSDDGECWIWRGNPDAAGYGRIKVGERSALAHRLVYELLVGPIADGLQLDHLCRVRNCVNPDHLEPVTNRENSLRGVAPGVLTYKLGVCQRGHSMDDSVTFPSGQNACRTCRNESARRRYAERGH